MHTSKSVQFCYSYTVSGFQSIFERSVKTRCIRIVALLIYLRHRYTCWVICYLYHQWLIYNVFLIQVIVLAFVVAFAYAQDNVQEDEGEATQGGPSPDAQDANVAIRKLRLRRPRPVSIDNVDGIAQGDPVPLRAGRFSII